MKNYVFLLSAILLLNGQVFAQDKKEKSPDEQIIVNRKYDENGNLIQYDSTYIHQWSSDSTFRFSFPDDEFFSGNTFPDFNGFFRNFNNDSLSEGLPFPGNFSLFDDDFFSSFGFGGFDNFQEFMDEQFQNFPPLNIHEPQFLNDNQREEWGNLIKKYQQEIEEFKKHWEQMQDN